MATVDEISTYLYARCVSDPESMWHLLEKRMHYQSHAVILLAVHLDQQQSVYFHPEQEEAALERSQVTTLLAWFELNSHGINLHTLGCIQKFPTILCTTKLLEGGHLTNVEVAVSEGECIMSAHMTLSISTCTCSYCTCVVPPVIMT